MNNDLDQFSEERLMEMIHESSKPEIEALARIALSVKQANPVAEVYQPANIGICAALGPAIRMINVGLPAGTLLYTTPQPAHTEQDGWIKCSERLPDVGSSVLVVIQGKHVHKGRYSQWTGAKTEKGRKPRFEDLRGILRDVTHWMALPAAPKPESE